MRNASDGPTTDAGSDWRHGGMSRRRNGEWWRIRRRTAGGPTATEGGIAARSGQYWRHGQYCWRTNCDGGRVERRRKGRRRRRHRRPIAARSGQFRRRREGRSYGGGGSETRRRRSNTTSTRSIITPAQGARARGRARAQRRGVAQRMRLRRSGVGKYEVIVSDGQAERWGVIVSQGRRRAAIPIPPRAPQ